MTIWLYQFPFGRLSNISLCLNNKSTSSREVTIRNSTRKTRIIDICREILYDFSLDIDSAGLREKERGRDKPDKIAVQLRQIARFCRDFSRLRLKTRLLSRCFFSPRVTQPEAINFDSTLLFVTFHGSRSPQLGNGTFERVNASVRDRRARPETKGPGFTVLRQCFRNNAPSAALLSWTCGVFRG